MKMRHWLALQRRILKHKGLQGSVLFWKRSFPHDLIFWHVQRMDNSFAHSVSRLCSSELSEGFIERQVVHALINACKSVKNWEEEVGDDVLAAACI